MAGAASATGINVHAGERDSRTGDALRLLIEATKEQEELTAEEALKAFFRDENKQGIANWESLKEVAEIFVKENSRVEAQGFYKGLLQYACHNYLDGVPDDIVDLVENNQLEDERVSQFLNGK